MTRGKINGLPSRIEPEDVTLNHVVRYNMGTSEKFPVHIPTFLQRNNQDPAIKVSGFVSCTCTLLNLWPQNFFLKLRGHLLPRIQAALRQEAESRPTLTCVSTVPNAGLSLSPGDTPRDYVFFKRDCIYHHKVLRFNFTTYDVRRGTDIVNPGTSRRNIMLLADHADGCSHRFLYARVLGAYHANVIYTGPGMRDYEARHFDFLWVRWYKVVDVGSSGWSTSTLDSVRFPPLHEDDSFGFVDPDDVLRGCHILPAFAKGKRQETKIDVSPCAKDSKDYQLYYVGRYVQQCHDESDTDLVRLTGFLTGICSCDIIGASVSAIFMRTLPLLLIFLTIRGTSMLQTIYLQILNYHQARRILILPMLTTTCTANRITQKWAWKTVIWRVGRMWRVILQKIATAIVIMIRRTITEGFTNNIPI